MVYSMVGVLAFLVNLVLNWEAIPKIRFREKDRDKSEVMAGRYGWFLLAANCYFLMDAIWGILYAFHDVPEAFPFLYSSAVFCYLFMLFTMLTWSRYLVAYLDRQNRKSNILIHCVWALFTLGIVELMINRFHHFIFSFNENREFIPESGRHIGFALQIGFYVVLSVHLLTYARKSSGQQMFRYKAVALTCLALGLSLFCQIFYVQAPFYAMGLMLGISLVHTFVEAGEKKDKEIHDHIAAIMAEDYEVIYYIDLDTGDYLEFSKSAKYQAMEVPGNGKDFFGQTRENIRTYVHPEDRAYADTFYSREAVLKNLEGRRSFSYKYRVLVKGEPRFFLFTVMRDSGSQYLVFYAKDIQDELMAEKKQRENQKKTVTFSQIAESLASNYDEIYYVNVADSHYVSYEVNNIFGQLEISLSGADFFRDSLNLVPTVIHRQDRERVMEFLNKDHLLTALEGRKETSLDYRLIESGKHHYLRMTAHKTSDGSHFIIGVENVDAEINREKQHLKALQSEKELARRDELTGIKNKTAYLELVESMQSNMDNGMGYMPFALVVCDANNLKLINDTQGHAAGDEYIKASARLLCNTFVHSPVFRVGGDEFAVFLQGNDYADREALMKKLRDQVLDNKKTGAGPILASGMADYESRTDSLVTEVFERADKEMYENKQDLKRD